MSDAVRKLWDGRSDAYFGDTSAYDAIAENPRAAFPAGMLPLLRKYIGDDLRGKRVCVPSSGDNVAAFGLRLLGSAVTSCDLSEKQIRNAKSIADRYGWEVEFHICDSKTLAGIPDHAYDLVYTSNGVHVWIDDLPAMYRTFDRVLKPGGFSLFFETHPMIRPFDNTSYAIKVRKPYGDVGPFDNGTTYAWRTQDFVNAIASAGLCIREMQEFHSVPTDLASHNYLYIRPDDKARFDWPGDTYDWRNNPWAALPQCLAICSQKPG